MQAARLERTILCTSCSALPSTSLRAHSTHPHPALRTRPDPRLVSLSFLGPGPPTLETPLTKHIFVVSCTQATVTFSHPTSNADGFQNQKAVTRPPPPPKKKNSGWAKEACSGQRANHMQWERPLASSNTLLVLRPGGESPCPACLLLLRCSHGLGRSSAGAGCLHPG